MKTTQTPFGTHEGRDVSLFTMENDNGMTVKITNYGGIVTSIVIPDAHGNKSDIVCGFDTLDGYFSDEYKANSPYFGCLVGRYAARIKDGRFAIDGKTYQLATNDGPNHLHGGIKGFDKCIWDAAVVDHKDCILLLKLVSPAGDEGYPGTLAVTVEYRLNNDNELRIRYRSESDHSTPVSLTNHTYFNLNGFQDTVLDHVVQLSADRVLDPDETNVPVGKESPIAGTVCDFNQPKLLAGAFDEMPLGFEHYYAFTKQDGSLEKVCEINHPASGRRLEVLTTEPGTLFYTGRYTSDSLHRENGDRFGQFRGLCVETSKYPNGPNIPGSPNSTIDAGQAYDDTTVYRLSWNSKTV
ncbi:MAG: galactose mutarotase [Akkermansiaceae bacterium]|jgi:aldose 1-epimerase|nr:galactose mutarotase [Akkermansiaceae bacterium]MDP4721346.1 galactose mutarotase [Akkermansiaceae bacterium]MDP4779433.1 galactose mutarotase [Akkermansiaceae bacterium]MDP4846773.1 galactose mutarotase [Akkermansiaceae bacterium]MDP4897110.1 galactose mutarotase [Akkermansiaceae bacterium]